MRKVAIFSAVTAASVAFSGVAYASQSEMQDDAQTDTEVQMDIKATVVEKGTGGRAQTVMLNGKEYKVCGGDVTDRCINPREAGLNDGNRALDYWPGKPASEM
tara:strand:- start:957 stop:1265 length:309 start_codon:yes stop_codon:yes gene_type:complete